MKSLHLCNLANVAYGYCKILRAGGNEARLICHDIDHVMSQPEWDDDDLLLQDFPDENDFFSSSGEINLSRPEWYERVDISHYRKRYVKLFGRFAPLALKELLRPVYLRFVYGPSATLPTNTSKEAGSSEQISRASFHRSDALKFAPNVHWLRSLSGDEEVRFAYVMAPVYTMLEHSRPYVAVEIGTMRSLPFEHSPNGRLLQAAYRAADHVLITNPDVRTQAQEMGLERYTFCPHPVDERRFRHLMEEGLKSRLLDRLPPTDLLGIAPARQNWELKGNHKYIEALHILRNKLGVKVSIVVPAWGQEIERSRKLAEQLGVSKYILWLPPQSESSLIRMYSNLDFVLDQFELGVFGLITPKALACGAVVITSYSGPANAWCFPEPAPVFSASTADDIVRAIQTLMLPGVRDGLGARASDWFTRFHSGSVVGRLLENAAEIAIKHHEMLNRRRSG